MTPACRLSHEAPVRRLRTGAVALLAALAGLAAAGPAAAICYQSPYPACATGNDDFKSTLISSSAFPGGSAGEPMGFVDPADNSARRFVPLHGGQILVWEAGTVLPTPFIDLSARVACCGERGLLSMTFHPDYATNGYFYVKYTGEADAPGNNGDIVIERYTRSAIDPAIADPASAHTVLVVNHSEAGNHNGGTVAFGPDGYLYISTGDGGNGCDTPTRDGQNPESLRGKLLRIDVDGDDFPGDAQRNYAIPPDNPYVGVPGADEVWAIGLRNPFRFSFDRANGDLLIGDVGQDNWEEINHLPASEPAPVNFGWVCREGCAPSSTSPSGCSLGGGECSGHTATSCEYPTAGGHTDPVLCFKNNDSPAWTQIIGGFRYRGGMVPDQAGYYFFADVAVGQIWRAGPASLTAASCWDSGNSGVYSFAEDHLGELYLVNGSAKRIECFHDGNPDGCYWASWRGLFEDDFESGDVARWTSAVQRTAP